MLNISDIDSNNLSRVKLTVDGLIVWDSSISKNSVDNVPLIGMLNSNIAQFESYSCNESFILQLQTISDTNIAVNYLARPIL